VGFREIRTVSNKASSVASHYQQALVFGRKKKVNVQKGHTSRRLVQTQPRPSGLEVQPAQDIGIHMPGSFGVVVKRTSESSVFCGSVEDFVPVRGEDSVKETRRVNPCPEVEISGRDRDSQRVIGMLDGKGSDTHRRNVRRKYV